MRPSSYFIIEGSEIEHWEGWCPSCSLHFRCEECEQVGSVYHEDQEEEGVESWLVCNRCVSSEDIAFGELP